VKHHLRMQQRHETLRGRSAPGFGKSLCERRTHSISSGGSSSSAVNVQASPGTVGVNLVRWYSARRRASRRDHCKGFEDPLPSASAPPASKRFGPSARCLGESTFPFASSEALL